MDNSYLVTEPVGKALIKFTIPLFFANVLQILYSTVDMYIVGHFADTADVSGVTTAAMLITVITVTICAFTTGVNVVVGKFHGAGQTEEIKKAVGSFIVFFIGLAVVIVALLLIFCGTFVKLLNAPAGSEDKMYSYLFICSIGMLFVTGYNVVTAILRALGNSKAPLIFVAISSVVNIIADVLLVKTFSMGAAGAAIATAGSQLVSFVASLIYCKKKIPWLKIEKKDIRYDRTYIRELLKISIPIALQEFLVNGSFVIITAIINKLGLAASAAAGITEKFLTMALMVTFALSTAVSSMTANNIGAKKPERAVKALRCGIAIGLGVGIVVLYFTFFHGDLAIRIFTDDPEVIENGRLYLKSYGFDQLLLAIVFTMNGYFNACGHSVFTMVHSLITTFIIRLPMTIIFGNMAGVTMFHMGIAAPISSIISAIMCVIFLWYTNKKRKSAEASY